MSYISGPGSGRAALVADAGAPEQPPVRITQLSGSNNLLEFYDSSGTLLSYVDNTGAFGGGAALTGAVILAPAASARNVIQPTADTATPLTLKGHSVTQSAELLSLQLSDGTPVFSVGADGSLIHVPDGVPADGFVTITNDGGDYIYTYTDCGPVFQFPGAAGYVIESTITGGASSAPITLRVPTTTTPRTVGLFQALWADSTDATRKGRVIWYTFDTASRECFRMETDGSAPMVGFLGATSLARQANTADLKDAFCGFGFQTDGGASPLDLDGGTLTAGDVVGAPMGCVVTLCAAFTPSGTGADTAEVVVPYSPRDGTTSVTWNVRRIDFRVQTAGGAPAVTVEKSTAAGAFSAATVGTVTLGSGAFEGSNTTSLGTVASGNKLRFNVGTLATAQNWTIQVELGATT
jgi:hypothetical protein